MTQANPPFPNFNGITYNPAFFNTSTSSSSGGGLTEARANILYLQKLVPDTANVLETFTAGILTSQLNTNNIDSSTQGSNLFIGALNAGIMSVGSGASETDFNGFCVFKSDVNVNGILALSNALNTQIIDTQTTLQYMNIAPSQCLALNIGHGSMITTFNSPVVFNSTTNLGSINAQSIDNLINNSTLLVGGNSYAISIGKSGNNTNLIGKVNVSGGVMGTSGILDNVGITTTSISSTYINNSVVSGVLNIGNATAGGVILGQNGFNVTINGNASVINAMNTNGITDTGGITTTSITAPVKAALNVGSTTGTINIGSGASTTNLNLNANTLAITATSSSFTGGTVKAATFDALASNQQLSIGLSNAGIILGNATPNTNTLSIGAATTVTGTFAASGGITTNTIDAIGTTVSIGTVSGLVSLSKSGITTSILGSLTVAQAIIVSGLATLNSAITLGYTTIPTFLNTQLGYTYSGTAFPASLASSTVLQTFSTITIAKTGVYLFNFNVNGTIVPGVQNILNCQITGVNASTTVTNYSGNYGNGTTPSNFSGSQVVRCTASAYALQFLCNGYTLNTITGYYSATRIA